VSRQRLEELRAKKAMSGQAPVIQGNVPINNPIPQNNRISDPGGLLSGLMSEGLANSMRPPKSPDNIDLMVKGLIIGMNQEGQMEKVAARQGLDITDDNIQFGLKQAQLVKLGTEAAIADVLAGPLAGTLKILTKVAPKLFPVASTAAKAIKASKASANSAQLLKSLGDFGKGAGIAGGSNLISNTGYAGAAKLLDPTNSDFSDNMLETAGEAGVQAAIGGVLNAVLGPVIRTYEKNLGAGQISRDVDERLGDYASDFTKAADGANPVNTVTKIFKAREAELKPIKAAMDKVEKTIQDSTSKIKVSDLPPEITKLIKKINNGDFVGAGSSSEVANLKKIFGNIDEAGATIDTKHLLSLKNNVDSILERGFSTEAKADLQALAGYIKRNNIRDASTKLLPESYTNLDKGYRKVIVKYGDNYSGDFQDLNKAYKAIESGVGISEETANKAISATNSEKSRVIGSLVDNKIITPKEVQGTAVKQAISNKGKDYLPKAISGEKGNSLELMGAGLSPMETAAYEGKRLGQANTLENIKRAFGFSDAKMPSAVSQDGIRLVDPVYTTNKLTAGETNLRSALGNTPESAALQGDLNSLQFLKQQGAKGGKEAASASELGQKLTQGFDAGGVNPESLMGSLSTAKLGAQVSPQVLRQLLQTGGGYFTNNKYGATGY
tara:strand:+ start:6088 stop:8091 length:2004 start_codon:yes stop_codon:yes gene_type:complete